MHTFRLTRSAVAAKLESTRPALAVARSTRLRPVSAVELAVGMVLSQPLRPAMPDPDPHPLRFGWSFESLPLTEAQAASVRLHSPESIHTEFVAP